MKKVIPTLAFMIYFLLSKSFAQFTSVWNAMYQHTTSPGFSNEGRKVAEDPSGNIFILSDNTSDIDPNGVQGATTYHYVSIVKYSSTGSLLNSLVINVNDHAVSGFDNPGAFGLEVDAAGDVFTGFTSYDVISGYDIWFGKLDNNLNPVWINIYNSNDDQKGIDFKVDPSGTIYAVVKSTGAQVVYSIIKSVPFSAPPVLVYTYPANSVYINSFDLDDGNQTAYVGGYIYKGGYRNAYVGAIDIVNGSVLWGTTYSPKGINGDDLINQITVGADGNIYSVGTSFQGIHGNQALVLKNTPGNKKFDFISLLTAGGIGVFGQFIDASEAGWVYIGAADEADPGAYVYRIPDDGIFSFASYIGFAPTPVSTYSSVNSLKLTDMKVSTNSKVYVTGSIEATGPSGDFTCSFLSKVGVVFGNALVDGGSFSVDGDLNNNYEGVALSLDYNKTDVYWIRNSWSNLHNNEVVELLDVNVPVPLRKAADAFVADISVSPNPATNFIDIKSEAILNSIEITDLRGSRISIEYFSEAEHRTDISRLNPGMYLVRATSENGDEIIKKITVN
jgi:hypothetical protein